MESSQQAQQPLQQVQTSLEQRTEEKLKSLFFNPFIAGYANPQLTVDELIPFHDKWWNENKEAILNILNEIN